MAARWKTTSVCLDYGFDVRRTLLVRDPGHRADRSRPGDRGPREALDQRCAGVAETSAGASSERPMFRLDLLSFVAVVMVVIDVGLTRPVLSTDCVVLGVCGHLRLLQGWPWTPSLRRSQVQQGHDLLDLPDGIADAGCHRRIRRLEVRTD